MASSSNTILIKILGDATQATTTFRNLSSTINKFGQQVRGIVGTTSQAVGGLRQMAQGVQNLGFVMTAFVGLPVGAAIKSIASDAIDFEHQMVEVQKTTGLADDSVDQFSRTIRGMSNETPTAAVDLAKLAAEAGRVGVGFKAISEGDIPTAMAQIKDFVRIVDMMAVSTNLSGELAATSFGKFISLFKEIDTSNIERLGSSINELGQASSAAETEIVGAMLRIAPAATNIGMAAQDVAALATASVQLSESASRAGTRTRAALDIISVKYQDVAKLVGVSAKQMQSILENEPVDALLMTVFALNKIEDASKRAEVAQNLFGTTGRLAIQGFSAAYPDLITYIGLSRQAFAEGTSLQNEFNRALGSTKNMLSIVGNNLKTVGEKFYLAFEPVIKEILATLIPAIQELGQWIDNLTQKQKLLIIGVGLFLTAGLPIIALLGSIGFAFSMVIGGILNFIGGVVGLVTTFASLGVGILGINSVLTVLIGIIGGGLVVAVAKATGIFDKIIDKLQEIASAASTWGGNIVAEIAGGMVSAASTALISALQFIGSIIEQFLGAFSPPKKGVLTKIGEWGKNLIDVYLQSFKLADFGVLRDIGNVIQGALESLVANGSIKEIDLGPMLQTAREDVAKLIEVFNNTGKVSEEILNKIQSGLGETGDEIAKLIRLQLEYNQAQKELEAIQAKKTGITEAYNAEIRAIQARMDLTAAQKIEAIAEARRRRDLATMNADVEEAAAKKTVDSTKEQLDWQKEYIDTLQDGDNIWQRHLDVLKKAANGAKALGKAIQDTLGKLLDQLKINQQMQALYESGGLDTTPLLREELNIRKNIVAELLKIKDPTEEQKRMLDDNITRIKDLQDLLGDEGAWSPPTIGATNYRDALDEIEKKAGDAADVVKGLADTIDTARVNWDLFKKGLAGEELSQDLKNIFDMSGADINFYLIGKRISDTIDGIKTKFDELKAKFEEVKGSVTLGEGESGWITEDIESLKSSLEINMPVITSSLDEIATSISALLDALNTREEDITLLQKFNEALEFISDIELSNITGALYLLGGTLDILAWVLDKVIDPSGTGGLTGLIGKLKEVELPAIVAESLINAIKDAAQLAIGPVGFFADNIQRMIDALGDLIDLIDRLGLGGFLDQLMGEIGDLLGGDFFGGKEVPDLELMPDISSGDEGDFDFWWKILDSQKRFTDDSTADWEEYRENLVNNPIVPDSIKEFSFWWDMIDDQKGFTDESIADWEAYREELVGHSIIPDMVTSIIAEFNKMPEEISLIDFSGAIIGAFQNMSTLGLAWIQENLPILTGSFVSTGDNELSLGLPKWATTVLSSLAGISSSMLAWIVMTAVPTVGLFISGGLEELAKIGTTWYSKISEGLGKIKTKFIDIFDTIKKAITTTIKNAINSILKSIEDGINKAVDAINSFIDTVNTLATAVGLSPIPKLGKVHIPKLASGGIAMTTTLAMIGEVPEAIIPLDRLDSMVNSLSNNKDGQIQNVEININNPVVRSDMDINRIADEVTRKLGVKMQGKKDLLGRAMGY